MRTTHVRFVRWLSEVLQFWPAYTASALAAVSWWKSNEMVMVVGSVVIIIVQMVWTQELRNEVRILNLRAAQKLIDETTSAQTPPPSVPSEGEKEEGGNKTLVTDCRNVLPFKSPTRPPSEQQ